MMRIEEFKMADLERCAELFTAVFNDAPWNESWRIADARVRIEDIANSPKCIGLVILEKELLGFVVGNMIRIEGNNIFELKEMCVRSETQRRGAGTRLLNELRSILPRFGADLIFLQTSHEIPAFNFYLKNGFRKKSHFAALALELEAATAIEPQLEGSPEL